MSRFCGRIGYATTIEDPMYPGVFEDKIVERKHFGDIIRQGSKWNQTTHLLDNIQVTNNISIVADKFSRENLGYMRYVVLDNVRWTIQSVSIEYPRIVLTLGGVYNGPTAV